MRFIKPFWSGIADGTVTLAYRRWSRPTVVAGRPYRTGGGRIEVLALEVVDPASITDADAARSGHASADEVRAQLRGDPADPVYRVQFRLLDEPDPREALANDGQLGPDDVARLDQRLDRLDQASSWGPWTRSTLRLIAERPEVRAPDLAESMGRETKPFKLDVRKLKNLGLTQSHRIGYRLSPRGRAYLEHVTDHGSDRPVTDE
jgi:hypothetical protein